MVFRGSDSNQTVSRWGGMRRARGPHRLPEAVKRWHETMDAVALRDRDANSGWASAADGTREERVYYCQNWRGDVVALVNASGTLAERVMYDAYGMPFGMPLGDVDGAGDTDTNDEGAINSSIGFYNVLYDLDLDNDVDAADETIARANRGATLGRGVLSEDAAVSGGLGNRKGYAGYEHDTASHQLMHVRHRVYHAQLGRWTRRDPLGYVDGSNLYAYVHGTPVVSTDPSGLVIGHLPQSPPPTQWPDLFECVRDAQVGNGLADCLDCCRANDPGFFPAPFEEQWYIMCLDACGDAFSLPPRGPLVPGESPDVPPPPPPGGLGSSGPTPPITTTCKTDEFAVRELGSPFFLCPEHWRGVSCIHKPTGNAVRLNVCITCQGTCTDAHHNCIPVEAVRDIGEYSCHGTLDCGCRYLPGGG